MGALKRIVIFAPRILAIRWSRSSMDRIGVS
jgi:hypothetical protein